jgi:hypothetical protein
MAFVEVHESPTLAIAVLRGLADSDSGLGRLQATEHCQSNDSRPPKLTTHFSGTTGWSQRSTEWVTINTRTPAQRLAWRSEWSVREGTRRLGILLGVGILAIPSAAQTIIGSARVMCGTGYGWATSGPIVRALIGLIWFLQGINMLPELTE